MKSSNYASNVLVIKALKKQVGEVMFEWCHLGLIKSLTYLGPGKDPLKKMTEADLDRVNFRVGYDVQEEKVIVRCTESKIVWEYSNRNNESVINGKKFIYNSV